MATHTGDEGEPRRDATDLRDKGDITRMLSSGQEKRQSMRGFEATYGDIVDYSVRITHRIWEEGDMGYIYETYAHVESLPPGV